MRAMTILASVAVTTFVFASGTVVAQNQQRGGQHGGQQGGQQQTQQQTQQQRQAERAMSQDRAMDQQRLQTRERTQDREQTQAHASKGPGEGIYGGNLMTVQERNQYRAELGALETDQARLEYQARHREKMQLRAKERGIDPQVTND